MATVTKRQLPLSRTLPTTALANVLLGLSYFAAAKLGLLLAVPHANITAIWPPSGIALAAVILYGYRLLPGVALGAFAANATTSVSAAAVAGITAGNTLEAFVGAYLLQRVAGSVPSLGRLWDILGLFGFAALTSTAIAATVGTLALSADGSLPWAGIDAAWTTWWMGDALGIIIITPMILVWADGSEAVANEQGLAERILLWAAALLISMIVFHGSFIGTEIGSSLTFVLTAAIVWAALRLSRREGVTIMFVVTCIAVWGTISHAGPFASGPSITRLVLLDGFLGVLAFTTLALSVSKEADAALRESERRVRNLLDAMPAAAYTCDADGLITYCNQHTVRLWGRAPALNDPADRFCGSFELRATDGSRIPHEQCFMALALRTGQAQNGCEIVIQRSDGQHVTVLAHANPIRNPSGRLLGAVNVLVDITQLKQVETALRGSEERVRLIIDSALDAVVAMSEEGLITEWNPHAEATFGWTREEALSRPLAELIIPREHRAAHYRGLARFLKTGQAAALNKRLELKALHKEGREFPIELTIAQLNRGDKFEFSAFIRDITDRKRAEESIRRGARQLQLVTDYAPVLLAQCDTERRYKFVNKPYASRFGLHPSELVGKRIADVVGEQADAALAQHFDAALSGRRVEFETAIPYKDLGTQFMRCAYEPELDAAGQVVGLVAAIINVTDRKLAEDKLRESEEQLRLFINHAPAAIAMFDRDMRYLAVSHRWLADYGMEGQDLLGRSHYEVFPEIPNHWRESHRRGLKGTPCKIEDDCFKRRDGTEQWIRRELLPWLKSNGDVGGIIIFTEDITEERRTNNALSHQREFLEMVARGAPLREAMEFLTRFVEAEAGGALCSILLVETDNRLHWAAGPSLPDSFRQAVEGLPIGEGYGCCGTAVHRKRQVIIEDIASDPLFAAARDPAMSLNLRAVVSTPIIGSNGEVLGTYALYFREPRAPTPEGLAFVEHTARLLSIAIERKRVERALEDHKEQLELRVAERTLELAHHAEALQRANDALARSNLDLQQFAYIASHDLQSPLRSISGFVQALQMEYAGKLDAEANEWIRRTAQATQKMQSLIQDLLAYSRIDSQARPFQRTRLEDVYADAVAMLDAVIRESRAKITRDPLPEVTGDRSQLVQLMQNLLSNALKYRGDNSPEIHVGAQSSGGECIISVRDNGIGIEPKFQERIFEIFQRLHNTQKYPGTGIGLAICRRVVDRHGGRTWVRSQPGKGSTFYFTIPETTVDTL